LTTARRETTATAQWASVGSTEAAAGGGGVLVVVAPLVVVVAPLRALTSGLL
jgi:hypothetical protein